MAGIKFAGAGYLKGAPLVNTYPYTMLMWVSRDNNNNNNFWFGKGISNADSYTTVLNAGVSDTKVLQIHTQGNSNNTAKGTTPNASASALQLVAIVVNSFSDRTLYFGDSNGVHDTNALAGTDDLSSYDVFGIGGTVWNNNNTASMWGTAAEFHAYNVALTSANIASLIAGSGDPKTLSGWVDGYDLAYQSSGTYTSLGGSRTLTAFGTVTADNTLALPFTRPTGAAVNETAAASTQSNTSSTGAATVTPASQATATVTSKPLAAFGGLPLANTTIPNVVLLKLDRTVALSLANQVTNGSGQLVIPSTALVSATDYMLAMFNADGTQRGLEKVTAV
jgi:hypothetical protein